jgi:hypothetical protein
MLRFLTIVLPTALFGFKTIDYFDQELVCVHVYGLSQNLPGPLWERHEKPENRIEGGSYFQIGLPELIVCRTEIRLLDIFAYFWPVTRPEIQRFQNSSKVLFSLPIIAHVDRLAGLETPATDWSISAAKKGLLNWSFLKILPNHPICAVIPPGKKALRKSRRSEK